MFRHALLLIALIVLFAASGCVVETATASDEKELPNAEQTGEPGEDEDVEESRPVETLRVSRGRIEAVLRSSTSLEAESQVTVYSQTTGLVTKLLVEEGQELVRGQILLRLESDEQRSELRKARSQLARQQRELARHEELFAGKLISEQDFNESKYQLEQLEIAVDDAARRLAYTTVRAPIAGLVSSRVVNLGDRVQVSAQLFKIVDFDSLVARIYLPEKDLEQLALGQEARIHTKASGGREYRGKVKRISPVVDAKSGTIKVTVAVGRQPGLRPGMYVDLGLVTETHESALLVPRRCLVYDRDQSYVFRVGEDSRAERVLIEARLEDKEFIEPRGAIAEGDEIVFAGQAGLKPGALVEVLDPTAEAASARAAK